MYQIDIPRLAALLREHRGRRSLRAVQNECGVSQSTLSRIENGWTNIDLPTFLAVCSWVQIHPADLITDTIADGLMQPPTLSESAAYALAPLDAPLREALLTIIHALEARDD